MVFKKPNSSKLTVIPAEKVLQKAQSRPRLWLGILAAIPVVMLVMWTLINGCSHSKPSKSASTKAEAILVRQTPEELAAEATLVLRQGDTEKFFHLLDTKIKDPNITNSQGDSLLLAAATLGNIEAVERLLAMGADVNQQNYNTRDTAILRSVYMDHDEITKLLVYERADLNLPNNYRQTPMGIAVEKQKGGLVDLFLTNGVKAGIDKETLWRSSAQKNIVGIFAMLKGGVDPNSQNAQGNSALLISASLGDSAAVRALLAYRANVNLANKDGNTALIYAARYNHPDTIMELLAPLTMQYRADLNAQNNKGETALYWAAQKGYAPVVKMLLAYDADPSLKTKEGLTALDVAKKYKRTKVIELLTMNLNDLKESFNQELMQLQSNAKSDAQKNAK